MDTQKLEELVKEALDKINGEETPEVKTEETPEVKTEETPEVVSLTKDELSLVIANAVKSALPSTEEPLKADDDNGGHNNVSTHSQLLNSLKVIEEELNSEDASISEEQKALLEFILLNYSKLESNAKTLLES